MDNQSKPKEQKFWQTDWFKEWERLARREYLGKNSCKPLDYSDIESENIKKKLSDNNG